MAHLDVASQRLYNQHIAQQTFEKPVDVVQWLGAVQAQDYGMATWAVGLRLQNAADNTIERAIANGEILRTHVMRPTWHFVAPNDIRWLLALTAPRVKAASASWLRKLELDDTLFSRSNTALIRALQGGKQCTRPELVAVLKDAGIALEDGFRATYIIMCAELDGILCSGAKRDKQITYALLDERVPPTNPLKREEALHKFVTRYFTGHGPATLQDFVWWSGLTSADAKSGIESAHLLHEVRNGQAYWFSATTPLVKENAQIAYLLPNYDEYIVGYKDRNAIFDVSHTHKLDSRGNILFNNTIIVNGRAVGIWKRTIKKDSVLLTLNPFTAVSEEEIHAITRAAHRYGAFLEKTVEIDFQMGKVGA